MFSLLPPGVPAVPHDFIHTLDVDAIQISQGKTQNVPRVDAGFIKHTPLRMEDFAVTCPLVPGVPHLVSGSCSSPRAFGLGFLQTPPHDDALALLLAFGSANTWREDFSPRSFCAMPGTHAQHEPRGYRVRWSALLACSADDAYQAVLLEEVDPKINTFVYQIKDVEFSDIVAVGKSNIVDFWVFSCIRFSRKTVVFTVEIEICVKRRPSQILVLETMTNITTRTHLKIVLKQYLDVILQFGPCHFKPVPKVVAILEERNKRIKVIGR